MSGKSLAVLCREITTLLGSRFEAAQLLFHITNTNERELAIRGEQLVPEHTERMLFSLCERRLQGEPLQYLLGEWEFYSLPFRVGPGVLIPRADTETLIDAGLELLSNVQNPEILDLCSGSGCIAVTFAHSLPSGNITAVELSPQALDYLNYNIKLNQVNVTAIKADAFKYTHSQPLDLLASNPPYIPAAEIDSLQTEVQHEPRLALDGGIDGLDFYRMIAVRYFSQLKPGGWFCLEVGYNQADDVQLLLAAQGCTLTDVRCDVSGLSRVVIAQKPY